MDFKVGDLVLLTFGFKNPSKYPILHYIIFKNLLL